jgi:riboflavin kinase/FMN adenylyltransferase
MNIIRGTKNIKGPISYPVVAIGNFDGVHVGHQILFRKTAELAKAKGGTAIAFTFEPHLLKILAPFKLPPLLTTFRKKMELIKECGIELVICADFTRQFSDQHPRDFANDILVERIGVKEVVVGFDYAFGRGREGTVRYLKQMGEEYGFRTHIVDPIKLNGHLVSSSYVRELIEDGEVGAAGEFDRINNMCAKPILFPHLFKVTNRPFSSSSESIIESNHNFFDPNTLDQNIISKISRVLIRKLTGKISTDY